MFYQDEVDSALRFGDVVEGFIHSAPCISNPIDTLNCEYTIKIDIPKYSVVLSPCCSIGNGVILLSPLIKVLPDWGLNNFIKEDFTMINRIMKGYKAITPKHFENMSPEKQIEIMNEEPTYCYLELFVYEGCELFDSYSLSYGKQKDIMKTNCYMIDFRSIYKINCEKIQSAVNAPLSVKKRQLSISTRNELRNKISSYFNKTPLEDNV